MYLYIKRLLNRLVSFWTLLTCTTRSIHSLSFHVSSLLKSNFSLVWNKLLLSASHTGFGAPNGPRRWGAPINGDREGGRAKPVQGLRYYSGHGRLHYLRTNRNMAVGRITVWTSDWLTDWLGRIIWLDTFCMMVLARAGSHLLAFQGGLSQCWKFDYGKGREGGLGSRIICHLCVERKCHPTYPIYNHNSFHNIIFSRDFFITVLAKYCFQIPSCSPFSRWASQALSSILTYSPI